MSAHERPRLRRSRRPLALVLVCLAATPLLAQTDAARLVAEARDLKRQHKLDEAQALLERVLELKPTSYTAHYLLGWVFLEKNDQTQAGRHFRETFRLAPDSPEGRDAMETLRRLGISMLDDDAPAAAAATQEAPASPAAGAPPAAGAAAPVPPASDAKGLMALFAAGAKPAGAAVGFIVLALLAGLVLRSLLYPMLARVIGRQVHDVLSGIAGGAHLGNVQQLMAAAQGARLVMGFVMFVAAAASLVAIRHFSNLWGYPAWTFPVFAVATLPLKQMADAWDKQFLAGRFQNDGLSMQDRMAALLKLVGVVSLHRPELWGIVAGAIGGFLLMKASM